MHVGMVDALEINWLKSVRTGLGSEGVRKEGEGLSFKVLLRVSFLNTFRAMSELSLVKFIAVKMEWSSIP
jgi:hypothetical protein